jgi:hypothetical protein
MNPSPAEEKMTGSGNRRRIGGHAHDPAVPDGSMLASSGFDELARLWLSR